MTYSHIGDRPQQGLVFFISLICFCCFFHVTLAQGFRSPEYHLVRWVVDGDTFFLREGTKVRLKGIDAPEISHAPGETSQYYGREAKRFLISIVWKRYVRLSQVGRDVDRFHRVLAYVYLPDGTFINLLMVKRGYAFCFPHPDQSPRMIHLFLQAQREAMRGKRGFWRRILSLPAAHQRFVGNRRTLRFHTMNCVLGRKISRGNRIFFSSLYDAFYMGYAPCRRCTIWPRVGR